MSVNTSLSDKQMAFLLATMSALMPLSIDAYLPAILSLANDLQADVHHVEQSLSAFMLGVAMGQLFGGSLSDLKGRRLVALGGLAVYALSSLAIALVQSAEQLLILRVVQALGGGMAAVMAGAVVRDLYDGKQAAQMFALIGVVMMAAPLLAPTVGSVLQDLGGWRSIFVFLSSYAVVVWCLLWRFLPDTRGGVRDEQLNGRFMRTVWVRYGAVLRHKTALGFLFLQGFSFGSMFVFLTESPFVYMQLYQLSSRHYAWIFALNIITMATFNRITAWRLKTGMPAHHILSYGLALQLLANGVMMVGVYGADGMMPLFGLVLCAMVSVGTQGLITANTQACFMTYFQAMSGTANAVLMASTSLIGMSMGYLATVLHDGTAYVMPSLMFLSSCLGMVLLLLCSRSVWKNKPSTL